MIEKMKPEQMETLRMLYPLFKHEVYARREQIMKTAWMSGGFLLALLGLSLYLTPLLKPQPALCWLFALGVLIFTGLSLSLIHRQKSRHAEAKQAVIDTEKALGLFEAGTYFPDRPLFSPHWQTRPGDPTPALYTAYLSALAVLVIASLFLGT